MSDSKAKPENVGDSGSSDCYPPIDDIEKRSLEQDAWVWLYCKTCDEDYRMPEDSGNCGICGNDLGG